MRPRYPDLLPRKDEQDLANDLYAIGVNLTATAQVTDPNIEETLVLSSIEAVNHGDHRIAGILVDWISAHFLRINVDRLTNLVFGLSDEGFWWVKIFWCANAQRFYPADARFRRLAHLYRGQRLDFSDRDTPNTERPVTEIFIQMKGLDERFEATCIRVPKNAFFHRPEQVFEADWIARHHMPFRYRVMMGASYRADLWALLRRNPKLSGYRLAKLAHCSIAAAARVKKDYLIVKRDYSGRKAV
ncbi:MAG: hypothetical protein EA369_08580 [Bradymonadales bacterium]|nr:MAG: hypothetical protein EA369_08580 [Bradymonadales bacterium]